jgi:hypothetical protein
VVGGVVVVVACDDVFGSGVAPDRTPHSIHSSYQGLCRHVHILAVGSQHVACDGYIAAWSKQHSWHCSAAAHRWLPGSWLGRPLRSGPRTPPPACLAAGLGCSRQTCSSAAGGALGCAMAAALGAAWQLQPSSVLSAVDALILVLQSSRCRPASAGSCSS